MKKVFMFLVLFALLVVPVGAVSPPVIDGVVSVGEWDGSQAVPMYLAGKSSNPQFATAHRICMDGVEYWWVDGEPSCIGCGHDQFVKMNTGTTKGKFSKICDNLGVGNYVDIPGVTGNGLGWECSGPAISDCGDIYGVIVHLSMWDGDWQSIRTVKKQVVQ